MHIYIPSLSREKIPHTLRAIRDESPYRITIVVQHDQFAQYTRALAPVRIVCTPTSMPQGIGNTRQWILHTLSAENDDDKFISMDDDLSFAVRRTDDPTKFRDPKPGEIREMLLEMGRMLDKYALISVATREGGHRNTEPVTHCVRAMRCSGWRRGAVIGAGVDHGENQIMEDFDVALALLVKGYPNAILNTHVQNQKGSNSAGGCSVYRTMESQRQAAIMLYDKYPEFVRLVEKTTKTAWGGETRTDVVIQWKRALAHGISKYGERTL